MVLSRDPDYQAKGAIVCHSVEETRKLLEQYPSEDIFVIGGQTIYEQFLPYCDTAHITWIDYEYQADTWFPNLDKTDWFINMESEEETYFNLCYAFRRYVRRSKK